MTYDIQPIKVTNQAEFIAIWASLSLNEQRFAAARLTTGTDADAARQIKLSPNTIRSWARKGDIEQCLRYMAANAIEAAYAMQVAALDKAVQVMVDLLDDPDPRIRQLASVDVMDRLQGKAVARVAPVMPDGQTPYQSHTDVQLDDLQVARINELIATAKARKQAEARVIDVTTEYMALAEAPNTDA
jgi:hypothetical protein